MSKYAIVAIGYNRVNSILRLLNSLQNAEYGNDTITLIISIDYSGSEAVSDAAKAFEWQHGKKEIRTFSERQGLRKHILSCADFLDEYDALFIFEDDVIVSPAFYHFGKACAEKYKDDNYIAGISLYALQWNPNANLPFAPLKTEYDTYFVQYAQSWGQVWLKKSLKEFEKWYQDNLDFFEKEERQNIPSNLYRWGENSWLKYHIAYCIVENKFFVYPYASYASVFTEAGTHSNIQLTRFQSEMIWSCYRDKYEWAEWNNGAVRYDAFFENMELRDNFKDLRTSIKVDLYGRKQIEDGDCYMLSTQILPYKVMQQYALQLRPMELNVYMDVKGRGIYLYDLKEKARSNNRTKQDQIIMIWNYFMRERFFETKEIVPILWHKFRNLIKRL